MHLGVIGVPTNSSGTTDGVALAPSVYRNAGLIDLLKQHCDVADYGDVQLISPDKLRSPESGIIAEKAMIHMIGEVQKVVGRMLNDGRFPLVLGGDCPILIGCLDALRRAGRKSGLLFVDGHEDAYLPHESPSGESADMELGLILGRLGHGLPAELGQLLPLLDHNDVSLLGARDAGILESDGVASISGEVEFFSDRDLQSDPQAIGKRASERLMRQCGSVWFHLDLDVLSTEALPAVDYQQAGGLSWEHLESLTEAAVGAGAIMGWDIAIYNPDMDPEGTHARRIVSYINKTIALISGRSKPPSIMQH